jgi:glyoxylase-like metal-dependent hydrolase (beta-lactamase superfamily II)
MTYSGHVVPGGPPDVRELAGLTITKMSVGEMDNNTYLLRCQHTDEQLLIDAAADSVRILELVGSSGLVSIVTTHQHWDHVGALGDVRDATGARTYAGADDVEGIPVPTDVPLTDGDTLRVGSHTLEVIHLVGHTPGSVALLYDDPAGSPHLWTGDSLFPGGVGNTFGSEENFRSLLRDVRTKLFDRLPDETWFYPGHGKDSTLGAERPHLAEWESRGW